MQVYGLPVGGPAQVITVGGSTVIVTNAPGVVDEAIAGGFPAGQLAAPRNSTTADLLIGFDQSPEAGRFDAQVPAGTQAAIPIPDDTRAIYIYAVRSRSQAPFTPAAAEFSVAWSDAQIDRAVYDRMPQIRAGGAPLTLYPGLNNDLTIGGEVGMVYDQDALAAVGQPHVRPIIPINIVDILHVVTLANTLFVAAGNNSLLFDPGSRIKLVHRIIVHVSAACTFVLGNANLAVGAPDTREVLRLVFDAAGDKTVDFGPYGANLHILGMGVTGAWKAYTSVAVTLDATIYGG